MNIACKRAFSLSRHYYNNMASPSQPFYLCCVDIQKQTRSKEELCTYPLKVITHKL